MSEERKYDFIFKILLLGDGAVGKTSIVIRFVHNRFRKKYLMTIGMEPYSRYEVIEDKRICYSIWDVEGQNRYKLVLPMFYRSVQASLIVFDITDRKSFDHTNKWVRDAKKESPDQLFFLIGNKNDLHEYRVISKEEAEVKGKELGALHYIETSALTGENIEETFTKIGNLLFDNATGKTVE